MFWNVILLLNMTINKRIYKKTKSIDWQKRLCYNTTIESGYSHTILFCTYQTIIFSFFTAQFFKLFLQITGVLRHYACCATVCCGGDYPQKRSGRSSVVFNALLLEVNEYCNDEVLSKLDTPFSFETGVSSFFVWFCSLIERAKQNAVYRKRSH